MQCAQDMPSIYIFFSYSFLSLLLTGLNLFNLNAFNTTETELKAIAAPAIIGLSNGPPKRYSKPAAIECQRYYK